MLKINILLIFIIIVLVYLLNCNNIEKYNTNNFKILKITDWYGRLGNNIII